MRILQMFSPLNFTFTTVQRTIKYTHNYTYDRIQDFIFIFLSKRLEPINLHNINYTISAYKMFAKFLLQIFEIRFGCL